LRQAVPKKSHCAESKTAVHYSDFQNFCPALPLSGATPLGKSQAEMPDGSVLVIGGSSAVGSKMLTSCEIFGPF